MTREQLAPHELKRLRWRGTLDRFAFRRQTPGNKSRTAVVTNVQSVTAGISLDHVWLKEGHWCKYLRTGDTFIFEAMVVPYERGYREEGQSSSNPDKVDYKLHDPRFIEKVEVDNGQETPLF